MKIGERRPGPTPELIEAYKGIAPATLGHIPGVRVMTSAIKPGYKRCRLVGPAFTVKAPGLDISATNQACELIQPGEIMVVDREGDVEWACIGEFRAYAQQKKGVLGWIIDGAATDIIELEEIQFPCFARSWSARVGKAAGVTGEINTPVNCGGVIVNPGDLIVADDNGVAVVSPEEAQALLAKCQEVEAREAKMRAEYKRG